MSDEKSDEDYFWSKRTKRVFASKRIREYNGTKLRIVSRIIESTGGLMDIRERDRLTVRETPAQRYEIVAKLYEDTRKIFVLAIQKYMKASGPSDKFHFSFVGAEIVELLEFLANVKRLHFAGDAGFNVSDSELSELLLSTQQVRRLVLDNEDAVAALARNEITTRDIVSLGYRRKQLRHFADLLENGELRAREAEAAGGPEKLWQAFFERNPWIFGYGLSYLFLSNLDDRKLEQVVRGFDLLGPGKRADGVMKTQGLISSLCFVEIKHSDTPLLRNSPYREGIWPPHPDLAGAISQVQGTVAAAVENLQSKIQMSDQDGNVTGEEVYNVAPRAFLIVGNLGQFQGEHGPNSQKVRSFELLRRNTVSPEILTFDELYNRAKFIVETEADRPSTPQQ